MRTGILYIVGTPIGNLEDITLRALKTLNDVDAIACEEPHVTRKLLARFEIHKPLIAYHQHSRDKTTRQLLNLLREGRAIAFVTSAGTPAVSDPGSKLVAAAMTMLGKDVQIIPIPGVSAVTTIASIAGFPMDEFHFFGYPPAKKGRQKFFRRVAEMAAPSIIFESPHRILRTLAELENAIGSGRHMVVGRELTKTFETVSYGTISAIHLRLEQERPRGEYALLICNAEAPEVFQMKRPPFRSLSDD